MENIKTSRRDFMTEMGMNESIVFENPDYDSAIIGYDAVEHRIVYDFNKMVEHLMDVDGMEYDEAVEFIEYNTIRDTPYAGPNAPIIIYNMDEDMSYMDYNIDTEYENYSFDAKYHLEKCIEWTKNWFEVNLPGKKACLGVSGGKDSTIAAAILAKALGPNNVIGVAMPDINQGDNDAKSICEYLGINYMNMPIGNIVDGFRLYNDNFTWSKQSETNIPPRIRMTMLYAIAQTYDAVVINTCNYSEEYTGYLTIFGDGAGGMSPIAKLTCTEVIALGDELGLPKEWVHKTPDDGLPNSKPDSEKMGFTYEVLDNWIRKGEYSDEETMNKIFTMYRNSQFKRNILNIPAYDPGLKTY